MTSIKPLTRPKTIKVRAYDELKSLVLNRTLPPGQVITEAFLSQSLGISRTPVRQALARLISEGLVIEEGGRLQVRRVTKKEAADISQFRLAIEGHTVRLLAQRGISDAMQSRLAEITDGMARLLTDDGECQDIAEYLELNLAFHMSLADLTDNRLLVDATERVLNLVVFSGLNAIAYRGRLHEVITEHRLLVDALIEGDDNKAYSIMVEHTASHIEFPDDEFES